MKPLYVNKKMFTVIDHFNLLLKNKTWSIKSRDIKQTISNYLKLKNFNFSTPENDFFNLRLKF